MFNLTPYYISLYWEMRKIVSMYTMIMYISGSIYRIVIATDTIYI